MVPLSTVMKACEIVAAESMNIRGMTREKVNTAAMEHEVLLLIWEVKRKKTGSRKALPSSLISSVH